MKLQKDFNGMVAAINKCECVAVVVTNCGEGN